MTQKEQRQIDEAKTLLHRAGYQVTPGGAFAQAVKAKEAKVYPKGKQKFIYYLHGPEESSFEEFLREEAGVELSPEAIEAAAQSRPFYEVALDCEVDETGAVSIIGINREKTQ